nr:retrotransposon protein, putative, unclassified [Tanacetum cinerariifolium]GEW07402.1 retrotransposon protein, putative, unclassified [Tanacetum cinerariifolium]
MIVVDDDIEEFCRQNYHNAKALDPTHAHRVSRTEGNEHGTTATRIGKIDGDNSGNEHQNPGTREPGPCRSDERQRRTKTILETVLPPVQWQRPSRLKDEIRLEVKLKKPRRLVEAMGMARLVEEKNNLVRKPFTPNRTISNPEETKNENPTNDALETQADEASELSALNSHELMGICDAALLLQIVSVLPQVQPELSSSPAIQKVLTDFCKASKCCFGAPEVNYLGYVISANGVAVENSKVQAVLSWPTPKSAKGVRGFLGLAGYYRKFIKDFGSIAAPLHRVVGKAPFSWDSAEETSFQALKQALTTTPTLGLSNCMKPAGLLQPLPIPKRVWEDISMDFIEGLPVSNGFSVVMVVVDRLSKYAYFIPLKHPFTAAGVAREFITNVVRLHGIPSTILNDRDKTDGSHESDFRTVPTMLYHMKANANRHRRSLEFKEGEFVLVKLQPYRQVSTANCLSVKLSPRYYGPYEVLARVGPVAYKIKLPPSSLVHDVFHVSFLRRFIGLLHAVVSKLKEVPEPLEIPLDPQPHKILEEWVITKGKYRPKMECLEWTLKCITYYRTEWNVHT